MRITDKARLDWLDKRGGYWRINANQFLPVQYDYMKIQGSKPTLRQAIDAAMKAEKQ